MPFADASRWFFSASLGHLSVAGALLLFGPESGALTVRWDLLIWLLLIGFIGCATLGFSLHLFSPVARRPMPKGRSDRLAFVAAEGAVVLGSIALAEPSWSPPAGWGFAIAAGLFLVAVGAMLSMFGRALAQPRFRTPGPERRPADAVTVPLFLLSWSAALGAGTLFLLSGLSTGPGFGWWLAAVHLFVLGHATLLIVAVVLRLLPRSLEADPPRWAAFALIGLGVTGAVSLPAGVLVVSPSAANALAIFAAPVAAFALLFFGVLVGLGIHARNPRPQFGLYAAALALLLTDGAAGLEMVVRTSYAIAESHALVGILGFVGLTILVSWFGMIAPFQRISHEWTRRMLWVLSGSWLLSVLILAGFASSSNPAATWAMQAGGGLMLGAAIAWGAGTIPVLFPSLNPLPGLSTEEIRTIRGRWRNR